MSYNVELTTFSRMAMQEEIVWTLRKYDRDAVCRLVPHVFGHELRVEIAGTLLSSVVCRTDDEVLDYKTAWLSALADTGWSRLILLRCRDCVNSVTMHRNLQAALHALDLPCQYEVIDVDVLPENDPWASYPAPTMLWEGADLFGLSTAELPYPGPS